MTGNRKPWRYCSGMMTLPFSTLRTTCGDWMNAGPTVLDSFGHDLSWRVTDCHPNFIQLYPITVLYIFPRILKCFLQLHPTNTHFTWPPSWYQCCDGANTSAGPTRTQVPRCSWASGGGKKETGYRSRWRFHFQHEGWNKEVVVGSSAKYDVFVTAQVSVFDRFAVDS